MLFTKIFLVWSTESVHFSDFSVKLDSMDAQTPPPDVAESVDASEPADPVPQHPAVLCGGKGNMYERKCRCDACRATVAARMQRYRKRAAARAWGFQYDDDLVSPEEAVKLIWAAVSVHGMTFRQIAQITGVTRDQARCLYHQRYKSITRKTHNKIVTRLDFDRDVQHQYTPTQLIDALPYHDILLRLLAQGWSRRALAQMLRDNNQHGSGFALHSYEMTQIKYQTARSIEWLAEHVGDRHGPSMTNKYRMWRRGVFPQIHYDEDGRLIYESLLPEQRKFIGPRRAGRPPGRSNTSVRFHHGETLRGRDGDGSCA